MRLGGEYGIALIDAVGISYCALFRTSIMRDEALLSVWLPPNTFVMRLRL